MALSTHRSTSAAPSHNALRAPIRSPMRRTRRSTSTNPTTPSIPEQAGATSITYGATAAHQERVLAPPAGRAQCVTSRPPLTTATVAAVNGVSTWRNTKAHGNGHASASSTIVARWRRNSGDRRARGCNPRRRPRARARRRCQAHADDQIPVLPATETATASVHNATPNHGSRRLGRDPGRAEGG